MKTTDSDFIGATASVLCMIHCLITPFLFAAQLTVTSTCADISPFWWKMVDYLFLVITFFAVYYTAKSTLLSWMPRTLYFFWILLALFLLNNLIHLFSIPHAAMYVPAISLSMLHLYNRNYCGCSKDQCTPLITSS